jgi:hypothetical protein
MPEVMKENLTETIDDCHLHGITKKEEVKQYTDKG